MIAHIHCSRCNALLKIPAELAGRKARCPQCAGVIQVPAEASNDPEPDVLSEIPFDVINVSVSPSKRESKPVNRSLRWGLLGSAAAFALLIGGMLAVWLQPIGMHRSSTPPAADALQALGYFRLEKPADGGQPSPVIGVVVSVPASALMPTMDEFQKILDEHRSRESSTEDASRSLPPSPAHVQLLKPSLFTLEFEQGVERDADRFLLPQKDNAEALAAHNVTLTMFNQEEFDKAKRLSFCIGIIDEHQNLGRPLRVRLRQEKSIVVPAESFAVADLPRPSELDMLDFSMPDFKFSLPSIPLPHIPIVTPPVIPKLPISEGTRAAQPKKSIGTDVRTTKPHVEEPKNPSRAADAKAASESSDPEKVAASLLRQAKALLNSNPSSARKRLEKLLKEYPGTAAAAEAENILRKM
jgi:hypothetical protein